MVALSELIALLESALQEPLRRGELARQFQQKVWASGAADWAPAVNEVLRNLAYDLDFFTPDTESRSEDPSYFGHIRFEHEVRAALAALRSLAER